MGLVISKGLTLKSYNTPAAIAGVAPTLDYRFALDRREIEAISLTDKLTYTGATNGTFVNRAGLIERATTDQPRFDHGPASRQSLGLLVEEQRTNSVVRSEEFDNASWSVLNVTVAANAQVAPNATTSAETITDVNGVTSANVGCFQTVVLADNTTYAMSCYFKAGTKATCRVGIRNKAGVNILADFNLAAVSTTAGNALSSSIQDAGNGWYRCTAICGSSTGAVSQRGIVFMDTGSYTADGTGTMHVWGAQLEVGAFPTSYIPTTTTALTRPVDSAVIDGTGVITGTYTLVEKPAGCAVVNGTNIDLVSGFTAERVMVFPAALSAPQITAIRGAM
jgi:hypothetical protein